MSQLNATFISISELGHISGAVVVWGAGGHAKVVADIIRSNASTKIVGFLDDLDVGRWGTPFYGSSVIGSLDQLDAKYPARDVSVALAVGANAARMEAFFKLKQQGFTLHSAISSSAYVSPSARIGEGVAVMPQVVINADTHIGHASIINTGATVDHDCMIEDGVHVAPGAHIAGGCVIHAEAFVGIGSCVKDSVIIGRRTMVGAGSVVVSDVPAGSLTYGNPARLIRSL